MLSLQKVDPSPEFKKKKTWSFILPQHVLRSLIIPFRNKIQKKKNKRCFF